MINSVYLFALHVPAPGLNPRHIRRADSITITLIHHHNRLCVRVSSKTEKVQKARRIDLVDELRTTTERLAHLPLVWRAAELVAELHLEIKLLSVPKEEL